MKGESELKIS